jgi:hypothetical protein
MRTHEKISGKKEAFGSVIRFLKFKYYMKKINEKGAK